MSPAMFRLRMALQGSRSSEPRLGTWSGARLRALETLSPGNTYQGIAIDGAGTDGNLVQGNLIGLDAFGAGAVPDGLFTDAAGVSISSAAQSNTIGGTVTGGRNIISGNTGYGLVIENTNTAANVVQGNTIGLDATSSIGIGNNSIGVAVFDAARDNQIGGTTLGAANLIASNTAGGVSLMMSRLPTIPFAGIAFMATRSSESARTRGPNAPRLRRCLSSVTLAPTRSSTDLWRAAPTRRFGLSSSRIRAGSSAQGQTFLGAMNATTGSGGTVSFSAWPALFPLDNSSPLPPSIRMVTPRRSRTFGTVTTTDSVGDGIPDAWRAAFFGGSGNSTDSSSCATCDPDHDGFSNLQEFYAGTNPRTNSSAFLITTVQESAPNVAVTFPSVAGRFTVSRRRMI